MTKIIEESEFPGSGLGLAKQRWFVIPVVFVVLGIGMASGVQRAALALYAKDFSGEQIVAGSYLQIAFALTGFGLMKAICNVVSGDFADKHGRKIMIIIGTIVYFAGTTIIVFFRYIEALFIGNALVGAGEGFVFAAAVALLVDAGGPKERASSVGLFEFSVYIGYSFGSAVAGIIVASSGSADDFQTPFYFSATVAMLAIFLAFVAIRNVSHPSIPIQPSEGEAPEFVEENVKTSNIYSNPTLIACYVNGHFGKIADAAIILLVPILLIEVYELDPLEMGMVVTSFTLAWALMMPLVGNLSDRFGRKRPIIIGLVLESVGLLGFVLLPQSFSYLLITSLTSGIGCGLYYPILSTIAVDVAAEEEKARVVGLFRGARDFGLMTGPLAIGLAASLIFSLADTNSSGEALRQSLQIPFFLVAGLLCIGALIVSIFVKETRPHWTQYNITLKHARAVYETVETANKGIQAFFADEYPVIIKGFAIEAKRKERRADQLKQEIVSSTYASARGAADSLEFLKLAGRLDRAGGQMMGAVNRLRRIPLGVIPPKINSRLSRASEKVVEMTHKTIFAIEALNFDVRLTPKILLEAEGLERMIDTLYRGMSQELFRKSDEMPIGNILQLKEVIDMVELAADTLKDACHMIRILSFMHTG